MDINEYRQYEADFAKGMEGLEFFSSGSYIEKCSACPRDVEYEDGVCYDVEPFFSWHACSICHSSLGGNREVAHAYGVDNGGDSRLCHFYVCEDCVYYAEYGRLGDAVMQEIEG